MKKKKTSHKRLPIILFFLYDMSRIGTSIKTESRLVAQGRKDQGVMIRLRVQAKGYKVSFRGIEMF